ncbi:hypothetical protein GLOIN_2v1773072 [Rhizophagus irregularis DAOM 181602=DAOM 197198]|nr:hypothetical protein GLOIN_2v1773072 [Rhizophagus irregularis DAOM 181602=DAOM 197198]
MNQQFTVYTNELPNLPVNEDLLFNRRKKGLVNSYFPIQKREDTRHNILYNDVITLLRNMDGLNIYLGTINYIWKVPLRSDHRSETENARVITAINWKFTKMLYTSDAQKCFKKY